MAPRNTAQDHIQLESEACVITGVDSENNKARDKIHEMIFFFDLFIVLLLSERNGNDW